MNTKDSFKASIKDGGNNSSLTTGSGTKTALFSNVERKITKQ